MMSEYVIPFEKLRKADVAIVGGKNASLGEMISQLDAKGVRVPTGFATTSTAFNDFLKHSELEAKINAELENLDINDVIASLVAYKRMIGFHIQSPTCTLPRITVLHQSVELLAVCNGREFCVSILCVRCQKVAACSQNI
mgnify:CR=1 FL=1